MCSHGVVSGSEAVTDADTVGLTDMETTPSSDDDVNGTRRSSKCLSNAGHITVISLII